MITKEILESISPEAREKAKTSLKLRFRYTNHDHPFVAQLIRFAYSELLERLAQGIDTGEIPEPPTPSENLMPPSFSRKFTMDSILQQRINLVALPQLVVQLQEAINSPKVSASDIAKIISNDVKLTASLLRLVNSPLYGLVSKVETVSRAVAIIGFRPLASLAMGATLISGFNKQLHGTSLEEFWLHSIACASIAKRLAEQTGRTEPERYFVDGLLHDIGRLFILGGFPDEAETVYNYAIGRGLSLHLAEDAVFGFSHVEIGSNILDKWNLSPATTHAVRFHHTPDEAPEDDIDDHHIIHLADAMAKALGYYARGDYYVPTVSQLSWEKLGLTPQQLEETIANLHLEIETVSQIMLHSSL
ncbi:HDOD domain-containing protein [Desulfovibrio mangrovi]|uniref:HDOD domain-containing protein n=1 Tax=Desulfovibrio mangrovi TaxID=2976983 RepID=UPI0022452503|nr:HDOD domain-containing protein [Desulfovibrio mangrovi]UZP67392.1 HDOD domain-containing protein [Desulfovibrio mangrovi]